MAVGRALSVGEKRCTRCAEIIRVEARVCLRCGHEFTDEEMKAAEKSDAKRKKLGSVGCAIIMVPLLLLVRECTRSATPEETAAKRLQNEKSAHDNAQLLARATAGAIVKERMKNPSSFDLVEADANEARTDDGQPCWSVAVTYRGTNSFGGVVTQRALVWVDKTGNTPLRVVDVR